MIKLYHKYFLSKYLLNFFFITTIVSYIIYLRNLSTQDYLRVEQYENWVVYDRWIKQIIEKWYNEWTSWNIMEWVQLLPQKLIETLAWKENIFKVIYLVKTDFDKVLEFVNDSLDNWDNSLIPKDFVSWSLQKPLINDINLRITFADLIVAYWKEIEKMAKENWYDVIETSWEKSAWIEEFNRKTQR